MRNKPPKQTPVAKRMTELGYTQTDLARRSRSSGSTINHLVRGYTAVPSLHVALRIARALQLETLADLERLFPKPRKAKVAAPAEVSGA